jgi:cbb3-type cytochrome oxidase subunit 1
VAATGQREEMRESSPATERVALSHLVFPAGFLALGSVLAALSLASIRFPSLFSGPISPGRLRAIAAIALVVGWLLPAGSGVIYYLLPRLTGTPLASQKLAEGAGPLSSVVALAGMVVVALGGGDGLAPLLLPWWLDVAVATIATVPLLVTLQTLRARKEQGVFVSVWFIAAAAAWLPILYVATNLPGFASVGRALQEVAFDAGLTSTWIVAIGVGGGLYTVTKTTGNPLGNRQVVKVAFWSLAFASVWAGPARLAFGATPDWLDRISAVLGLALPVAIIAAAAGMVATIDRSWNEVRTDPGLMSLVSGMSLAILLAVLGAAAGFRSPAGTLGFTAFWDAIDYGWTLGVATLLFSGVILQGLPAIAGRRLADSGSSMRAIRLTVIGTVGVVISGVIAGLLTGFVWTGASFVGGTYAGLAETWTAGLGPAFIFIGFMALFGVVAAIGQVMVALSILRTLTSGRAGIQEVLVTGETL